MRIVCFTPLIGTIGTKVQIELTGVPEAATISSLAVILSGSATLSLDSLTRGENNRATLEVTLKEGSQSGELIVCTFDEHPVSAKSATPFTVDVPEGQPKLLLMTPNHIDASNRVITIHGEHLQDVTDVQIGSVMVHAFDQASDGSIRVAIPRHIKPGAYRVAVRSRRYGHIKCPQQLVNVA